MTNSHPHSSTVNLKDCLIRNLRLPSYQRDFAWDPPKMRQLWEDLRSHLLKVSQIEEDSPQYFLGSIVVDEHGDKRYLVDGQQRFTTLTLISCAIRDALISSGFYKQAHEIQKGLIFDMDYFSLGSEGKRFELLDIPPEDPLSSEFRIGSFREPLTNIRTGLVTKKTKQGEKEILIDIKKSTKIRWTMDPGMKWKFRLWDETEKALGEEIFTISKPGEDQLKFNDRAMAVLSITAKSPIEILAGMEIVAIPNVRWPGIGRFPLSLCESTEEKRHMNKHERCDLFDANNREFYLKVRSDAEHFIRGKKIFRPTQGIKKNESSTALRIVNSGPEGEMPIPGRLPTSGSLIKFTETIPKLSKWPTKDELVKLIEDGESSRVEFKQSFRKYYGLRSSEVMVEQCVKAVSGFLNTSGGFLLVGVRDSGTIAGINDEYQDNDEAIMRYSQKIRKYIGQDAAAFVDYKVYNVDFAKIMCVKVDRCPKPVEVSISKWTLDGYKDGGPKKRFYVRMPNETLFLEGEKKKSHIEMYSTGQVQSSGQRRRVSYDSDYSVVPHTKKTYEFQVEAFSASSSRTKTSLLSGVPTVRGKVLSSEDIPPNSVCEIPFLEDDKEWRGFLDSREKRADELQKLIERVCFARIIFHRNPSAAISHFMLTNDSTRVMPLNAFDLVSAFTQKLIGNVDGSEMNPQQKKIKSLWETVSTELYIAVDKKDKKINDFFVDWLLSTHKTKGGTQRYKQRGVWEGIQKEFNNRTDDKGQFDYGAMLELYNEMSEYMVRFCIATNTNSKFWNRTPYTLAECRDERTLLKTIQITGTKQHIPAYIALVTQVEEQNADREVISRFLFNLNYVLLRFNTIPSLLRKPAGFKGNTIYAKQLGEGGWIQRIRNSDLSDEEQVDAIGSLPLEVVPNSDDLDQEFPWGPGREEWRMVNVGGTANLKQIRHLMYSIERALDGSTTDQHPQMSRIHDIASKPQVEHIIPKAPRMLGGKWFIDGKTTDLHKEYVYALGNHCLIEDSKNSAARNKVPSEKARIYVGSDFKTTFAVGNKINVSGTWDVKEIEENSEEMMEALVSHYDV